ncbi:MAG: hypothetical protein BBJ57_02185 [Desulfobacterales bacterium PC51MH44]|nr:MAG: hypothetical protein BBJ57_02185 [Desulfobacterales bacterium PC51MH44]
MSVISAQNFKTGCELGTYQGGTTFFLLDNLPDLTLHTVDIFEQQPEHENYKEDRYDFTDRYPMVMEKAKKYGDRLVVHKGWTHEVAEKIEPETFDFVFIDADHNYEGVKRDILAWKSKIKQGGFLMGHDANLPSVAKAVKECCSDYHVDLHAFCWAAPCE